MSRPPSAVLHAGDRVSVQRIGDGCVELRLDRLGGSVNQLDEGTLTQLRLAIDRIKAEPKVAGLLVTSGKDGFMVGADLLEFRMLFSLPQTALAAQLRALNEALVALEDLDIPSVAALNGYALGGGLEFALSTSLRVFADDVTVGLPEVALGLIPAFGGMVRLPRLIGVERALDWILSGRHFDAAEGLRCGVADACCTPDRLRETALQLLRRAIGNQVPWRARQENKRQPLEPAGAQVFDRFRASVEGGHFAGNNLAAMRAVIEAFETSHPLHREEAIGVTTDVFASLANTQASAALIQTFLNRRMLRRRMRTLAKTVPPTGSVAVGPHARSLALGVLGAAQRIAFVVTDAAAAGDAATLARIAEETGRPPGDIEPVLREAASRHAGAGRFALVIHEDDGRSDAGARHTAAARRDEAPVADESALADEALLADDGLLLCLDAARPLDDIAAPLRRPQRLLGLNCFGALAGSELVEILRATATSERSLATAMRYARTLGKTAIVVRPGHRSALAALLAAHLAASIELCDRGLSRDRIDAAVRRQGWTRSPFECWAGIEGVPALRRQLEQAGLNVGRLDADRVDAGAFHADNLETGPLEAGRPARGSVTSDDGLSDAGLTQRAALVLALACCRLLEADAVASPAELDVAALLCAGFPPDLGGPLQYVDWLGAHRAIDLCDRYGLPCADIPRLLHRMALEGLTFFGPTDTRATPTFPAADTLARAADEPAQMPAHQTLLEERHHDD